MNRYTVNFICEDKEGHKVVRSEEIIWTGLKEAIEIVKKEWGSSKVKILWAGIRRTDGGL
jgi:hypothetical protein